MTTKQNPKQEVTRLYRSPLGAPIRACLGSGQVALIGDDWRTLRPEFHRAAVLEGAEVKSSTGTYSANDVPEGKKPAGTPLPGDDAAVRKGLITMLSREKDTDFNKTTGLPNLKALGKLVGFEVSPDQAARVLRALKAEAEVEEQAKAGDAEKAPDPDDGGGDEDDDEDGDAVLASDVGKPQTPEQRKAARKKEVKAKLRGIAKQQGPRKSPQGA